MEQLLVCISVSLYTPTGLSASADGRAGGVVKKLKTAGECDSRHASGPAELVSFISAAVVTTCARIQSSAGNR